MTAAVSKTSTLHILLVAGEVSDRSAIRRALGTRAELDDAPDGIAANLLLAKRRYDLALIDWFLPPDSGLTLFARLRKERPDMPVVFLSGHDNEDVVAAALHAGASDTISRTAIEEKNHLWRTSVAAIETHRLRSEADRSRARLALAVEAAGAGTWELDLSSKQFRGDARFRALFGLEDKTSWSFDVLRATLNPDSAKRLDDALGSTQIAVQLQLLGETVRWLDVRGRHEVDPAGDRVFGTVVDLTAVKQEEARSAALRERLMGIASHDLKNPLSAVLQASALLAQSPRLDPKEKRYVGHIRSSAERMTHLIVQLLDLTRVRLGGGLPIDRKKVHLDAAIRQVVDEHKLSAPERVIELNLEALELEADVDRVSQLASNLIGNALKHSPPDTPVSVQLTRENNDVVLAVKNRGKPIPPEAQANLFEPFAQVGDRETREGLGLGLYISREIAAAHGGALTVTSNADEGTTFTARLPTSRA